jgi:hypothetical protein
MSSHPYESYSAAELLDVDRNLVRQYLQMSQERDAQSRVADGDHGNVNEIEINMKAVDDRRMLISQELATRRAVR